MFNLVNDIFCKIKKDNPLILNITNHVTLDFVANGLLCVGASPIMSFAEEEIEDLVKISSAIVINIGTLNEKFNELCHATCRFSNQYKKPLILDPVGAGATSYRTQTCFELLKKYRFSIVRANASEVMALAGTHSKTKGVDSQSSSIDAVEYATTLSSLYNLTVCMSGKVDVIIDQNKSIEFDRGSALMPKITGTGCLLSAIVAAFQAVHTDSFEAAGAASLFYSVCGEIAEPLANGPASFKQNFLDRLYQTPIRQFYE